MYNTKAFGKVRQKDMFELLGKLDLFEKAIKIIHIFYNVSFQIYSTYIARNSKRSGYPEVFIFVGRNRNNIRYNDESLLMSDTEGNYRT